LAFAPAKKEQKMAAYLMVQSTIRDPAQYQKYRDAVLPLIKSFGGKVVVRGAVEVFEGEPDARPMVVFEFPSLEAVKAFWNSPDYVPVKQLREGVATLNVWAVTGL
jgi:uncharacterized protein (DUF1330 family)